MGDRTRNSIITIISSIALQITTFFLTFLDRSLFIYLLGEVYLGISGLFKNVLGLLAMAELGIGTAISFYLYKPAAEKDKETIKSMMRFYKICYRCIGAIIFIVGLLLIPFLKYLIKLETEADVNVYWAYVLFVTNSAASYFLFAYKSAIFNAFQQNYKVSLVQAVCKIITSILTIVVLAITKNYYLYLVCMIVSTLVVNIAVGIIADKTFPILREKNIIPLGKEKIKKILRDVYASFVFKIGNVLLGSTDNIIISYICGTIVVGYYSNYFLIISAVQSLYLSIMNAILPSVGNLNAEADEEKQLDLFYKLDFANSWLLGICSITLAILLQPFIYLWTLKTGNPDYVLPEAVSILLSLNLWIMYYLTVVSQFKITKGLFWQGKYIQMIEGILNIVLSIVFGKIWGLIGIVVATTISMITVGFVPYAYYVFRDGFHKPLRPYLIQTIKRLFLVVIIYLVVKILCFWIVEETIYSFIYRLVLCIIIPNIAYFVVYRKSEYFGFVKSIIKRLIPSR